MTAPGSEFDFDGELFEWEGQGAWHFVAVPEDLSEEIRARTGHVARGFGSLRVRVVIGGTPWTTSVFPSKEGVYVLPVKKPVRRAEDLHAGDTVTVHLQLLDL
jgi:hypothetical protein